MSGRKKSYDGLTAVDHERIEKPGKLNRLEKVKYIVQLNLKAMVVLAYFLVLVGFTYVENNATIQSKKDILTGASHQSWRIYSASPDHRCTSASDDVWTFFSDGTFEFDHGAITENEEGKCSDFVNIIGQWQLLNNETEIRVAAVHEKGNSKNTFANILLAGTITQLDNERLVVSAVDASNQTEYSLEFRKN